MEPSKTPVKDRLKKKASRKNPEPSTSSNASEGNIFEMLGKVSEILKQNPEMLNKVNKCVSNIIDNRDLMDKLSSQIKENMTTIDSDSDAEDSPEQTPDQVVKNMVSSGNMESISEIIKNDIAELQNDVMSIVQTLDKSELKDSSDAS